MQTSWPLGGNTRVGTCPSCGTQGQPRDKPIQSASPADCFPHQQVKHTYLTNTAILLPQRNSPSINPYSSRRGAWGILQAAGVYLALTFMLLIQPDFFCFRGQ